MSRWGPRAAAATRIALVLALAGLAPSACTDRPVSGGDDGAGGTTTGQVPATTSTSSSSTSGAPQTDDGTVQPDLGMMSPCPVGFEMCGDECANLRTNRDHCGECGRVCPLHGDPPDCAGGECRPILGPCALPQDGIPDCPALCATVDQDCAEGGNGLQVWFAIAEDKVCLPYPHLVENQDNCGDPFPWDAVDDEGNAVAGVRCLCTNNPD